MRYTLISCIRFDVSILYVIKGTQFLGLYSRTSMNFAWQKIPNLVCLDTHYLFGSKTLNASNCLRLDLYLSIYFNFRMCNCYKFL